MPYMLSKPLRQALPYLIITVLLLIIFSLQIHLFYPGLFFLDDPYIVLHSARVMHSGYDANFPGTAALMGNSSAVHLWLVYLLLFFVPPIYALILINWVAIFAYSFGLIYLSKLYRCSAVQTAAITFCGLFTGAAMPQLLNGLETSLAMAAIISILILASLPCTRYRRYSLVILLGSVPFIRPELIAFSGSIYLFQLYRYKQNHCLSFKGIAQDLGLMLLAAAPWLIWYWCATHHFYPITISAKSAFFAHAYQNGFHQFLFYCWVLFKFFLSISIIYIASLYLLGTKKLGQAILLFMVIFSVAYCVTEPSILTQNIFRYFYLFIPLLLFGLISTLQESHFTSYVAKWALILITITNLCNLPRQYMHYQQAVVSSIMLEQRLAAWCSLHLPQHENIAIQDAGYIAYATSLTFTDFVGLKSEENIALHQRYTKSSHGMLRTKAISIILQKKKVRYLIMTKEWVDEFHTISQLTSLGWHVILIKNISVHAPGDMPFGYFVYNVIPPK